MFLQRNLRFFTLRDFSPCPAKGVWQKKETQKVTEASEKVTKKSPEESRQRKKVIELLSPTSFCGTLTSAEKLRDFSLCAIFCAIVIVFGALRLELPKWSVCNGVHYLGSGLQDPQRAHEHADLEPPFHHCWPCRTRSVLALQRPVPAGTDAGRRAGLRCPQVSAEAPTDPKTPRTPICNVLLFSVKIFCGFGKICGFLRKAVSSTCPNAPNAMIARLR